eukprot:jgi/Bigna1/79143/fgenesh1_pg.60_\
MSEIRLHRIPSVLTLVVLFIAPRIRGNACEWTAPTGDKFDLSGLSHKDYWMIQDSQKNFRYYLNICKNAKLPKECVDGHVKPSPALQVEAKSWKHLCKDLASLDVQTFNLLDPKDAQKGFEMTYGGGDKCGTNPREIRFHFICSPHFDEGPLQIFETTKSCHYNVTWATKHGCPVGSKELDDDDECCTVFCGESISEYGLQLRFNSSIGVYIIQENRGFSDRVAAAVAAPLRHRVEAGYPPFSDFSL